MVSSTKTSLSRLLIIIAYIVLTSSAEKASHGHWDYHKQGPDVWHKYHPACSGTEQSPVDIKTKETLHKAELPPFNFSEYKATNGLTMSMNNNGHTAQLAIKGRSIYLKGGGLPSKYKLLQIHFHWGPDSSTGSEHTLDGQHFAMEMHIVHIRREVEDTPTLALKPFDLAVLGFFITAGQKNDNFQPIIDSVLKVTFTGFITPVDRFPLYQLLPESADIGYFRYQGSLTTPPCHQSVIWTVSNAVIQLSEEQINAFRTLKGDNNIAMYKNYRPTQRINYRKITASYFPKEKSVSKSRSTSLAKVIQPIPLFLLILKSMAALSVV